MLGGAWGGNWLCRRVRIARLVVGGGMEESEVKVLADAVDDAPLGCLLVGWLKRRMKELLRAGRDSVVGVAVNVGMLFVLLLAGRLLLKEPGAGKSLRLGSYERLLAKSSKLTEGRKS